MALTCAKCGAKVDLSPEQRRSMAGKFFACPECGDSRKLPPFSGPIARKPETLPTLLADDLRPRSSDHFKSQADERNWWGRIPWPKRAMLIATVCWLAAMPATTLILFVNKGGLRVTQEHYYVGNRFITRDEAVQLLLDASIKTAVTAPTFVYAAGMVGLFVIWFCTKPDQK